MMCLNQRNRKNDLIDRRKLKRKRNDKKKTNNSQQIISFCAKKV